LKEWQLHLERMLSHVGRRQIDHDRCRRDDGICCIVGDRDGAERRLERASSHDRHALEPDVVGRPDEHDDIVGPAFELPVRVGRHGSEYTRPAWGDTSAMISPATDSETRAKYS